jgi:hypothetical protein
LVFCLKGFVLRVLLGFSFLCARGFASNISSKFLSAKIVYALFNNPKAKADEPKFQRLKQEQQINGWKIKEIKYDL